MAHTMRLFILIGLLVSGIWGQSRISIPAIVAPLPPPADMLHARIEFENGHMRVIRINLKGPDTIGLDSFTVQCVALFFFPLVYLLQFLIAKIYRTN
jgi:hypothetical protein